MAKRQNKPLTFSAHGVQAAAFVATAFWLGIGSPDSAFAQAAYRDEKTAEGWAWSKIRKGDWADFNQRCNPQEPPLDVKLNDVRWLDDCRKLNASFVQDLLTREPWRTSTPYAGVRIKAARIVRDLAKPTDPDLDLENAKLIRSAEIIGSRIEVAINLRHVQTDSFISVDSSLIKGAFDGEGLHSGSDLSFAGGSILEGAVNLQGAKVDGNLDMMGARLDDTLEATGLRVDGSLEMSSSGKDRALFHDVKLNSARIGGNLEMRGGRFEGALDAANVVVGGDLSAEQSTFKNTVKLSGGKISGLVNINDGWFGDGVDARSLQVGSNLGMQNVSFVGILDISSAKISGFVDMRNSWFKDRLKAYSLQVGGYLTMKYAYFSQMVDIGFARISEAVDISDANFNDKLEAFRLQVGGYVKMQDTSFAGNVNMAFAKVDNNLDLRHATVQKLDLSGALISGEFQIGLSTGEPISEPTDEQSVWNLRNAHIGNLTDTKRAWPEKGNLILNGVTIDHLGGTQGDTEEDMLKRGADWWDEQWANLNIKYSPSPYSQLSTAFLAMGDREDANEIRYRAREHERTVAWEDGKWGTWLLLTALKYIAGYGIGLHAFYVLYWVLGLSLAGALVLWWTVPEAGKEYKDKDLFGSPDRVRGLLWCFGASLSRLLPLVELKEFQGLFEKPEEARFKLWQRVAFSLLGLAGWILGGVLILAVSGLTQNS